ncbi:bifunctional metallophosphatase/5'-nucleotidase [Enhygromyxa salina]|uniref:Trifunctional nucleotide phosphoesterase protein YfkN n=1 Tax=Enhygromyxa salina TaxID=215803 RepID=A0A2S9YTW2_9BACT|nr:bifunctional metallophosphatase/5'-nucleotidase [Enhygromyxa salina]PRQ08520.1 Trifunctional nucleotide phosphoesterase protein YfkN precursor [Enhygromyxa salina]
MSRRSIPSAALTLVGVLGLACEPAAGESSITPEQPPVAGAPVVAQVCGEQDGQWRFRILHINDVYRIEGLLDGRGGVARIRSLRTQLEADCDAVLVTHAGDALFPSLLSRKYLGEQMVDALNLLDGDPERPDPRMFATFGNHEFDKDSCDDAGTLAARVEQSQFSWLATNVVWKPEGECATPSDAHGPCPSPPASPIIDPARANILPHELITLGGLQVGLYSLMTDTKRPDYVACIDTRYIERSHETVAMLRSQGADVVLALTHLDARNDASLLAGDGREDYARPDLVLGGHDHTAMTRDEHNVELGGAGPIIEAAQPAVIKGDADAVKVRVIEVSITDKRPGEAPDMRWTASTVELDDSVEPDPQLAERVAAWLSKHEQWFCQATTQPPGCLTAELVEAGTTLVAEENEIRMYETNLGSWIADQMLRSFAGEANPPTIALINSGSLRLNQTISAGAFITQQIVEELFAYRTELTVLEVNGYALRKAIERSVEGWEAGGHWLQLSGIAFYHANLAGRSEARSPSVINANGELTLLDDKQRYRVVVPTFLAQGNDGYWMLNRELVEQRAKRDADAKRVEVVTRYPGADGAAPGPDLKTFVLEQLRELDGRGEALSPQLAGRICSADRQAAGLACLVAG